MKLSCVRLLRMRVYTVSEKYLGRVTDVVIDYDTGVVMEYVIRGWFFRTYTISRERVIRIEHHRMIVEDRVYDNNIAHHVSRARVVAPPDTVSARE